MARYKEEEETIHTPRSTATNFLWQEFPWVRGDINILGPPRNRGIFSKTGADSRKSRADLKSDDGQRQTRLPAGAEMFAMKNGRRR